MNKTVLCAALAGVLAVGAASHAFAADMTGKEKCFGIAKAGKNDCDRVDRHVVVFLAAMRLNERVDHDEIDFSLDDFEAHLSL